MKTMTCIVCPRGCNLNVEQRGEEYSVSGNMCKRGIEFAINEITNPTRSVTSTVKTIYPELPRLPVRTDKEVPLGKIREVMKIINKVVIKRVLHNGDIIVENLFDLGINIIATSDMKLAGV